MDPAFYYLGPENCAIIGQDDNEHSSQTDSSASPPSECLLPNHMDYTYSLPTRLSRPGSRTRAASKDQSTKPYWKAPGMRAGMYSCDGDPFALSTNVENQNQFKTQIWLQDNTDSHFFFTNT